MPTSVTERVATAVRVELARRQLRAHKLADVLNISQAAMSNKLHGISPFTVLELELIARSWQMPIADLIPLDEDSLTASAA